MVTDGSTFTSVIGCSPCTTDHLIVSIAAALMGTRNFSFPHLGPVSSLNRQKPAAVCRFSLRPWYYTGKVRNSCGMMACISYSIHFISINTYTSSNSFERYLNYRRNLMQCDKIICQPIHTTFTNAPQIVHNNSIITLILQLKTFNNKIRWPNC